jgi:hypothetical protein
MSVEQILMNLPAGLWTGIGDRLVSTSLAAVDRPDYGFIAGFLLSQLLTKTGCNFAQMLPTMVDALVCH